MAIIDLDADPFVRDGCLVEEHRKGGKFTWDKDAQKGALYLSMRQHGNEHIAGRELRKELAKKPVLNANVLDYLLANPHLIPEEWKDKYIFFWGTVYRSRGGSLFVRCLYWCDGWYESYCVLDLGCWRGKNPAVVRAN